MDIGRDRLPSIEKSKCYSAFSILRDPSSQVDLLIQVTRADIEDNENADLSISLSLFIINNDR